MRTPFMILLLAFSMVINGQTDPVLVLTPSTSPISLVDTNDTFYQDIAYGVDGVDTNFDIFLPDSSEPSSLLIIIHGGGFINGDKSDVYSNTFYQGLINNLLAENVAVATINYHLVVNNDTDGIIRSLNDCKRSLQFMRYYSASLNIDKTKVAIFGTSAGAAAGLWIAFNDDMADAVNPDPVLGQSTRIQGLVCGSPQSNYDCMEWPNNVFSEYQSQGFDFDTVKNILTEQRIFDYFGVSSESELFSPALQSYRDSVNMLDLMSSDDPEFYATSTTAYEFPTNSSVLYHHPLHVKALKDRAESLGVPGVYYMPTMGIDTRNGESTQEFILRKIGSQTTGTIIAIPDDAFEAYLEEEFASNIAPDGSTTDGFITFIDINLVTDIDFVTPNVASPTSAVVDLTGVNQFPELLYLVVRNNNITGTINVSGLTKLRKVYADGNPNLTQVILTGCESLQQFKASGCALTSLDLSTTTLNTTDVLSLTDVDVDTNNLSTLNISGHTGIDYLDCATNNNLTSIDISSLTLLTLFRFQKCDIIGDIDVSANPNLSTLGAYDNDNLTSIDLGSIPYTNFTYFKTSSSNNLSCIFTDNPSDFQQGGPLEIAIGSNYSVDVETHFVVDSNACQLLSVNKSKMIDCAIYPNPSQSILNIRSSKEMEYQLTSLNGQIILSGKISVDHHTIEIGNLTKGVYLLQLVDNQGNSMVKKIVKV